MKRIVVGSIVSLIVLIAAAIAFYYSQQYAIIPSDPINAIPSDAAFFFEIKNGKEGASFFSHQQIFSQFYSDSSFRKIFKNITGLDSVVQKNSLSKSIWENERMYISVHPVKANDFDYLFLCNLPRGTTARKMNSLTKTLTENRFELNRREYESVPIFEWSVNHEIVFTYAIHKGILMGSTTSFLVEEAIRQLQTGAALKSTKTFSRISGGTSSDTVSVYINYSELNNMLAGFTDPDGRNIFNPVFALAKWTRYNITGKNNSFDFSGSTSVTDSSDLLFAFRTSAATTNRLTDFLSLRTSLFIDFSGFNLGQSIDLLGKNRNFFDDEKKRNFQLDSLKKKWKVDVQKSMTSWIGHDLALVITEPGTTDLENNIYACIHAQSKSNAMVILQGLEHSSGKNFSEEMYHNHPIGFINYPDLLQLTYGKLFSKIKKNYFTSISDYIVFANQPSLLKNFIDDYESGNVLSKDSAFISVNPSDLFSGNLNIYFDFKKGINILRSVGNDITDNYLIQHNNLWKQFRAMGFSYRVKGETVESKGKFSFSHQQKQEVQLAWSAELDTTAINSPDVIYNSTNQDAMIAIQDTKNSLYLFDESGSLMWKKNIGEKILSHVFAVDYYHNGNTQLLFNTAGKLFLTDLNGDSVGYFPIRLPAPAANGCSIINFDNNSSDVLIACSNGIIYAYQTNGKPENQWLLSQPVSGVSGEILPLQLKDKTFVTFYDSTGNIYFSDRRGKIYYKEKTESAIQYFDIAIEDSSHISRVVAVDTNGKVYFISPENLPASENLSSLNSFKTFIPSASDYIASKNDSVYIYSITGESKSKYPVHLKDIHFAKFNDGLKNLVGFYSISQNEFYFLDENGFPAEGFPVKGSSSFSIIRDKQQEKLVIAAQNGTVYLYTIH